MMVFRRRGLTTWTVSIPTPGGKVRKSTGTTDKATADAIESAVKYCIRKRETPLLNALLDNKITVGQLYDAYMAEKLPALRAQLDDVDLEPFVAEWKKRIAADVKPDTLEHYVFHVRSLLTEGKPFPRSRFTVDALDKWPSEYPATPSTRRKAHSAMSNFAQFLGKKKHLLEHNPMRPVDAPAQGAPRERHIDVADMKRLANYQPEPFCALSALLGGTGIEVTVALALKKRDVDVARREIRAAGTKTHSRDRIVRVADWAWEYVAELIADRRPNDRLFPGIDRWQAADAHNDACDLAEIEDYQLRDQRHSYAVRAERAGTPAELIARQLGHANAVRVLKVYGKFMPSQQDRDKWEKLATLQDEASEKRDTVRGTVARKNITSDDLSPSPASSRGGTRTRDPGIMSAVL
jgi:integrase